MYLVCGIEPQEVLHRGDHIVAVAAVAVVLGCIFAGAVHDYLSGMLSVRHGGVGLPELVGHYLGKGTRCSMLE